MDIALNHGHGCELVLDGRNPELPEKNKNGYFVGPTIIKDVTPCNPLFTTEVFGPLVATIKIADIDDALELIRQSEFGNGACIFTQSQFYAEKFSRDADVGMVGVNVGICAPHPYIPFGGIKGSLLGTNKAQGKDGIDFFTQNKVTTIRTVDPNAKKGGDAAKPKSRPLLRSVLNDLTRPVPGPQPRNPRRFLQSGDILLSLLAEESEMVSAGRRSPHPAARRERHAAPPAGPDRAS